ncbi:MAG: hypothetical protein SV422_02385 [Pseudomonadota bacterium]|nr:hypothetical protein [Pseudomonadota bacterium]
MNTTIARAARALPTLIHDSRLELAASLVVKAAAVLAVLFLLGGYLALPTLPIFGHDEVHYYNNFYFKLVEDGRWLNYLLHNFLRSIPLPIWSVLYVGLWWALMYRIARGCGFDVAYAILVAATITMASPFLEMSLWPASVVPSLLLIGLAILMQARGAAYPVIYMISGMLMFGAMQSMYFLIPLLFLRDFLDETAPLRARWWLLLRHMLWWVAGSIAGVIVVCIMLRLLAGIWFIEAAEWRNTQPVEDVASLVRNLMYVARNLALYLEMLLRQGGVTYGFILICAITALLRVRALFVRLPALLLLAAVLLSFFAFSVPMAPVIHLRSLFAMATVVVLGLAILPGSTPLGRVLGALLLLKMALHYSLYGQDYLDVQRAETSILLTELRALFPGYPTNYTALALEGEMDPAKPEANRFNDGSRMHPIFMTIGAREFLDCKIPQRCDRIGATGEVIAVQPYAGGQFELSVDTTNNIGIVRYRD